jgi:hypothetical protein
MRQNRNPQIWENVDEDENDPSVVQKEEINPVQLNFDQ